MLRAQLSQVADELYKEQQTYVARLHGAVSSVF